MSKLASRKLWISVVAFFAPIITQVVTNQIGWREALRLSVLAAVGYCVAQGAAEAGQGIAARDQAAVETLANRPVVSRRRPAPKEPV